jgi:hypothetical protein
MTRQFLDPIVVGLLVYFGSRYALLDVRLLGNTDEVEEKFGVNCKKL